MKHINKPIRTLVSAAVLATIASAAAHAGGFSLYTEGNGYSTGNYGAGVSAEARDASTAWYNPAGLALIHDQQAVFGGVGIFPTSKLSGTATYITPNPVAPGTFLTNTESFSGLDGGVNAFVPSFHYARPLGENVTFGFSVVSPFGLSTMWGEDTAVRYAATKSELIVIDASPSIGGKITEHFSLGAGIDLQYAKVKFNSIIGSPALAGGLALLPTFYDSLSYNKGHSTGVGFHAGGMLTFNDKHTRIGLNYQSKVKHKFHGYSRLTGPLASGSGNVLVPAGLNQNASARSNNLESNRIEFPEIATLSAYHDVNTKLALLGSVVYTGWHTLRSIQLKNVAVPSVSPTTGALSNATANSTSTENYRNVWRWSVGANYQVNEQFMLRAGGGYDQTPTRDGFRTVRLPDVDRWALAVGGHYQYRPDLGFDLGYTYLWGRKDSVVNKTQTISTSTFNVNASGRAHAHLVGAQLTWNIDGVDEKSNMKK